MPSAKMQTSFRIPRHRRHARRGVALVYVVLIMLVMIGFVSMAADLGRVQVAQTQLQLATDSAARYGALGLQNIIYGVSAAPSNAATAGLDNNVDGTPLVIDPVNDVQLGFWDTVHKTFTVVSDPTTANAVKVTAVRTAARGNAIPLTFLKALGRSTFDIQASSIAMLTPGASVNMNVLATSNPFLAGQPAGVSASNGNPHSDPDWTANSPNPPSNLGGVHIEASPPQVPTNIPITPGASMTFDGINGGATNDYTDPARYTADGNLGEPGATNTVGDEHGIANMKAPINSLVGLYLDNTVPGSSTAPADLDFSTDASRNFTTLSPKLNQLFFIGDGRDNNGNVQQFVVPTGAKRLFIGTWDDYEWNNNIGSFSLTVHAPGTVATVQ
jgi:Flp pilus assembly protein TadG